MLCCICPRKKSQPDCKGEGAASPSRPLRPDRNIVIDLTPAAFREMVGNLGPGKVRVTVKVI